VKRIAVFNILPDRAAPRAFFPMAIRIERHDDGGGIRLVVHGDVDLTTGDRLESELLRAEREAPQTLTLDLADVVFFDSTGLQILLDADIRAREDDRRLVVVPGHGEAARVLALAEVVDRLNVAIID
jgi:anti-sigma B factor antagonist